MDDFDDELRELFDATRPSLVSRDELVASLVARVDAGASDVADAPKPPTAPSTVRNAWWILAAIAVVSILVTAWLAWPHSPTPAPVVTPSTSSGGDIVAFA